jgi:hypothetical protein
VIEGAIETSGSHHSRDCTDSYRLFQGFPNKDSRKTAAQKKTSGLTRILCGEAEKSKVMRWGSFSRGLLWCEREE